MYAYIPPSVAGFFFTWLRVTRLSHLETDIVLVSSLGRAVEPVLLPRLSDLTPYNKNMSVASYVVCNNIELHVLHYCSLDSIAKVHTILGIYLLHLYT